MYVALASRLLGSCAPRARGRCARARLAARFPAPWEAVFHAVVDSLHIYKTLTAVVKLNQTWPQSVNLELQASGPPGSARQRRAPVCAPDTRPTLVACSTLYMVAVQPAHRTSTAVVKLSQTWPHQSVKLELQASGAPGSATANLASASVELELVRAHVALEGDHGALAHVARHRLAHVKGVLVP